MNLKSQSLSTAGTPPYRVEDLTRPYVAVHTGNPSLRRHLSRALVSIGCRVTAQYDEAEMPPIDGPVSQLHIVDAEQLGWRERISDLRAAQPEVSIVAIANCPHDSQVVAAFGDGEVSNLVARHGSDGRCLINEMELITTCHKLLTKKIFGIERYLNSQSYVYRNEVTGSLDRPTNLLQLEGFLESLCCQGRIGLEIVTAADELLTNAIFNAPRDTTGAARYANANRSDDIKLSPDEYVEFSYACDSQHVAVSVKDHFGELRTNTIVEYLKPAFLGELAQIDGTRNGGAGVGINLIFNSATQLIFNIQPHIQTEVIALFYIRGDGRAYRASGRSLNIFKI